ncbi:MAG: PKD domain-containing protein [Chitinophagales bacterium]
MKTTTKLLAIVALFATVLFAACKKEEKATPAPVADFTISPNDTIFSGETITFTNTSTDADTYLWNFGDGTTSTTVSPTKTEFVVTGEVSCEETFTVTLTATKNGKTSTKSKNVVVEYCR